jgi:hypothetical protein
MAGSDDQAKAREKSQRSVASSGSPRAVKRATLRPPTRARRVARILSRTLFGLLLVLLLGFGALYIRLLYAPISMSFLVPTIERSVNNSLTGMRFDIGDAVLRAAPTGFGIEFRLTAVSIVEDNGSKIVESPMASAEVSFSAMLRGRLAVDTVELIGPRLFLQYSEERGLALSFGDPNDPKPAAMFLKPPSSDQTTQGQISSNSADQGSTAQAAFNPHATARAMNLSKVFSNLFSLMRKGESAYLTSFGIRDAKIFFDRGDQITSWEIPSVQIELEHVGKNSILLGEVVVKTSSDEWRTEFRASQDRHNQQLSLSLNVNDIIPSALAAEFPTFMFPQGLQLPVSTQVNLEIANTGDILSADVQASLKAGKIDAPWDLEPKHPAQVDSGELHLTYSREAGRIDFKSMNLQWDDSFVALNGAMERQPATGQWAFHVNSDKFNVGAKHFGLPAIPLDGLSIKGTFDPRQGVTVLDHIILQGASDAKITLAGEIRSGSKSPGIQLTGEISPMPVVLPKLIWPPFVANGAREWIGKRVPAGRIAGGVVKVNIPPDVLAQSHEGGTGIPHDMVDVRVELQDLELHYLNDLPPMRVPRATASFSGQRFFFTAPEGNIALASGEYVYFSDGEFIIGDLRPRFPDGEMHFKTRSSVNAALELLDHPPLNYIKALNMKLPEISGTANGSFSIALPLIRNLKFQDLKLNGRTHIDDMRASNIPGGFSVHSGKFDFDVSEKSIGARGELKMNNLPIAVIWQRIFDAAPDQQPPLRIRTVLDDAARNDLGLGFNQAVHGPVPAELAITTRKDQPPLMHFEANLGDAEVQVSSIGWKKLAGQRGMLNIDLHTAENGNTVLRNLNLLGDDLEVRGEMLLNDKRRPISFSFPTVTLNAQTKMEMRGDLSPNNVWTIRASGPIFDGRQFFRSLFSAGQLAEEPQREQNAAKSEPGLDVRVEFENVIGFFDTNMTNIAAEARRRNNKLVYLDMHGRLSKDKLIAARVEGKEGEPRKLLAESMDAGAAFRLIGLYPSARGGEAQLTVDLDGSGAAEKTGALYARNFVVLSNNEVFDEVLVGTKNEKKRAERTRAIQNRPQNLEYIDQIRVPFSVGAGQLVLHQDTALIGPAMSVTMRGNIDFKRERIDLSGTYTPAAGLNGGAIQAIPIIGDIFVGREGEGIFGLTFGVKGTLSHPEIEVNPLSPFAPGVIRQIFEDPSVPRIIPADKRKPETRANSAHVAPRSAAD